MPLFQSRVHGAQDLAYPLWTRTAVGAAAVDNDLLMSRCRTNRFTHAVADIRLTTNISADVFPVSVSE